MRYKNKEWCNSMRIRFDYNGTMQSIAGKYGLTEKDIETCGNIAEAAKNMRIGRSSMRWRELPYSDEEVIRDIEVTAENIRKNFSAFVVLGIGGSALGPIAVHTALCHPYHNEISGNIKFYCIDNVDPVRLCALFDVIDIEKTAFNVITKSGGTSETMSQLLIITDLLKQKLGNAFAKNIFATTDREKGNLIKIAKQFGIKTFFIPEGVGGRFSELSPVGLLPAAVCGIDIRELLSGAAYADGMCENDDIYGNIAYMSACLQAAALKKGVNIHVCMPYSDRLRYISDWYAQLLGESIGKKTDRNGNTVHMGQTPVKALGVTDQHSQIQLYTEGPFDKIITFICVDNFGCDINIPSVFPNIPDVDFLSGHTQGELINTERFATEYAVTKSGHLCNTLILPEVNAFTVGQLMYLLEVQTAFLGELVNVNAFDQPGVEEGKNAAYALLGKNGYEAKRAELEAATPHSKKYII